MPESVTPEKIASIDEIPSARIFHPQVVSSRPTNVLLQAHPVRGHFCTPKCSSISIQNYHCRLIIKNNQSSDDTGSHQIALVQMVGTRIAQQIPHLERHRIFTEPVLQVEMAVLA